MNPSELQKVQQEIKLMQRFSHPCIVKYVQSFIEDSRIIIIMENCAGGDLEQLIRSHSKQSSHFPESCIVDWTLQIVSALAHIHSLKIIHRDIKPSNIFVTLDGKLKLGDFGISKALSSTNDVAMTQIGTTLFMSPEVCNNLPYTNKCDIWAVGCVLYELATFRKPFVANSFLALAMKIIDEDPEPLAEPYSEKLAGIVRLMLSKDPKARPSCSQIFSMLGLKDLYLIARQKTDSALFKARFENIDFESTVGNFGSFNDEDYYDDFESDSSDNYEEDFEL